MEKKEIKKQYRNDVIKARMMFNKTGDKKYLRELIDLYSIANEIIQEG